MPRYSIPAWEMCVKALKALEGDTKFVPLIAIVKKVRELYPSENVNKGTIRLQVRKHCVNCHPTHDDFPDEGKAWRERKLFVTDNNGKYRFYSDQTDRALYIRALNENGINSGESIEHPSAYSDDLPSLKEAEALAFIFITKNIRSEGVLQADCTKFDSDTLTLLLEKNLIQKKRFKKQDLFMTTARGWDKSKILVQKRLEEGQNELSSFLDSIPPKLCPFLLQEVFIAGYNPDRPFAHPIDMSTKDSKGGGWVNSVYDPILLDMRVDFWRKKLLTTLQKLGLAERARYYIGTESRSYVYCIAEEVIVCFTEYFMEKERGLIFTPEFERDLHLYHFFLYFVDNTRDLNDEETVSSRLIKYGMAEQEFQSHISTFLADKFLKKDGDWLYGPLSEKQIRIKYLEPIIQYLLLKPDESRVGEAPSLTEPKSPAPEVMPQVTRIDPVSVWEEPMETLDLSITCEKTGEGVVVRRGFVPSANCIMVGVRIENRNEDKHILQIRTILEHSEVLELQKTEGEKTDGSNVIFSSIGPGEAATAIYHLAPRVCMSTQIRAHVMFRDGATNEHFPIEVPALTIDSCKFVKPRPFTTEEFHAQTEKEDTQSDFFVVHDVDDLKRFSEVVRNQLVLFPVEGFARLGGESLKNEFFGLELDQAGSDVKVTAYSPNAGLILGCFNILMARLQVLEGYVIEHKTNLRQMDAKLQQMLELVSRQLEKYSKMEQQKETLHQEYAEISRKLKQHQQMREDLELAGQFEKLIELPEQINALDAQLNAIRKDMKTWHKQTEYQLDQISTELLQILVQQQITEEFLKERLKGNWEKLKGAWKTDKKRFLKEGIKLSGLNFLKLIGLAEFLPGFPFGL